MSSYYTEKHRHSRRLELPAAGTVMRRVEVRRPSREKSPPPAPPAAASARESTKEPKEAEPKEEPGQGSKEKEGPSPSPPAPEWSKWEPIEGAGWDGHWRAKASEDGEWLLYFKRRLRPSD
jgi:hypothetical protein